MVILYPALHDFAKFLRYRVTNDNLVRVPGIHGYFVKKKFLAVWANYL